MPEMLAKHPQKDTRGGLCLKGFSAGRRCHLGARIGALRVFRRHGRYANAASGSRGRQKIRSSRPELERRQMRGTRTWAQHGRQTTIICANHKFRLLVCRGFQLAKTKCRRMKRAIPRNKIFLPPKCWVCPHSRPRPQQGSNMCSNATVLSGARRS